ncbi:J domain-containing protein [Polaromonas sp.]|uniref:J domain-containing protein n=1 Tax=Polaromonas sp. TaxID=1869339 RepID=UPI0027309929|nr:J domain-containing protein [Polaromonas sp.]MDP1886620.1 J domain-containing protein [Polaromonas sp.]
MTEPISRFPLQWPTGWKRIPPGDRKDASFSRHDQRLTIADGLQRILAELGRMGIPEDFVIVSSNLETRLDGMPRSGQSNPADPGVAVYWQKGGPRSGNPTRCLAIDRYFKAADNMGAIAATLDHMRGIERHGGAEIVERAYTGFTALPAPAAGQRDWWTVLEIPRVSTPDEIRKAHRILAAIHHPDRAGGSGTHERMAELNKARDQALQERGQ